MSFETRRSFNFENKSEEQLKRREMEEKAFMNKPWGTPETAEERIAYWEREHREEEEFVTLARKKLESGEIDKDSELGKRLQSYLDIDEEVNKRMEKLDKQLEQQRKRSPQEIAGDLLGELVEMARLNQEPKMKKKK